jgi:hypothetical protein
MASIHNLQVVIQDMNFFRKFANEPEIVFPLSQKDINEIASDIDCRLSPENLHCDGEISVSEANRKYQHLTSAFRQLEKYAESIDLKITQEMYEV